MSNNRVENLLAVKWFDGLLVGSSHLAHIDRRMDSLLGEACGSLMDQPGLLAEESGGGTPSQLIEIDSQTALDEGIEVNINVTRGFQALSPRGSLVVGMPNAQARFGTPVTSISATLSTQNSTGSDVLVCAAQIARDDLKIELKDSPESTIELGYPGLRIDLAEPDDFKHQITGDYHDHVVIGMMSQLDGELAVDAEYIPPVIRLQSVASFNDGIITSLKTLIQDLYRLSVDLVRTSNEAVSQGQMGADLLSRRTDYLVLRTLLLNEMGRVRHVERISPVRLMFEIMTPLATWWRQYSQQQFKQAVADEQSPVKKLDDLSNALMELSYSDLCAGSGELLRLSKELVDGINRELGMIG
jgi:hypothetical protein